MTRPFFNHQPIHNLQRFFGDFIRPGDLVFDVGANHGVKTAVFLSLGATVIAVEPQPDLIAFLAHKFPNEIAAGNLVLLPMGLDKTAGSKNLHVLNDYDHAMATFSEDFLEVIVADGSQWRVEATSTIEVATLDQLILHFGLPRYCKIDVEGLDYQVLQGLSHPIEQVSFEYNTKGKLIDLAAACIPYLVSLAPYEFNYECMNRHQLFLDPWVSADVMTFILYHELGRTELYGDIYARLRAPFGA